MAGDKLIPRDTFEGACVVCSSLTREMMSSSVGCMSRFRNPRVVMGADGRLWHCMKGVSE